MACALQSVVLTSIVLPCSSSLYILSFLAPSHPSNRYLRTSRCQAPLETRGCRGSNALGIPIRPGIQELRRSDAAAGPAFRRPRCCGQDEECPARVAPTTFCELELNLNTAEARKSKSPARGLRRRRLGTIDDANSKRAQPLRAFSRLCLPVLTLRPWVPSTPSKAHQSSRIAIKTPSDKQDVGRNRRWNRSVYTCDPVPSRADQPLTLARCRQPWTVHRLCLHQHAFPRLLCRRESRPDIPPICL